MIEKQCLYIIIDMILHNVVVGVMNYCNIKILQYTRTQYLCFFHNRLLLLLLWSTKAINNIKVIVTKVK